MRLPRRRMGVQHRCDGIGAVASGLRLKWPFSVKNWRLVANAKPIRACNGGCVGGGWIHGVIESFAEF